MKLRQIAPSSERLERFCQKHHIRKLSVFGSALREDFDPADSDVDILVGFEPGHPVGLICFARIQRKLAGLRRRNVSLNTPAFLSRYFHDEIMQEAEMLYDAARR